MSKKFVQPKGLPDAAFKVWESVFNKNKKKLGDERAAKVAWAAVKNGWKKKGDKWVRKQASEIKSPDTFRGSVTDLSDLQLDPNAKNISSVEIMRVGKWDHPIYGDFEITMGRLEKFRDNFDSGVRNAIAVDVEHKSDEGAVGWFKQVYIKENSLFADIEWTPEGIQLIRNKKYKFFSPEYSDSYENAATGEEFTDVLIGGAITNRPFFQELNEVVLSDKAIKTKIMSKLKITKKRKGGGKIKMTKKQLKKKLSENIKFKPAKEDKVSDKVFKEVLAEVKAEKAKAKTKTKKHSELKIKKLKATDKVVKMSESEVRELQKAAALGVKAHTELRSNKCREDIQGMVFSEENSTGVLLPKSVDSAHKLLFSLRGKQRKMFKDFLGTLPKAKLFGEIGDDQAGDTPLDDGRDELDRRAKRLMSENPKKFKEYSTALHAAEKEMSEEGLETDPNRAK